VISADEYETIKIQKKTMDWTGELVELFRWAIMRASTLPSKASGQSTIGSLLLFKELDQIQPAKTHWTFTSPAAMIGIALAIFLIGMLIWKKCFSKPNPAEATLLVPSAPPMPASNQPQRPIATLVTNNQATKSNASIPIHINIS